MPFTGQLGTPNSQFGNIVFGVVTGLGLEPFDVEVHVLTSSHIRVLFTRKVTEDTALVSTNYLLTSLALPGTAVVPAIEAVEFFDETRRSVTLILDKPLTYSTDYSLQVDAVRNDEGEVMAGIVRNFTANVQDPPRALGAWQSKRGAVDVLFDRSVGPTSGSATFEIRDASLPGPGVAMAQLPWAAEDIPETTLRLTLPGGTPVASAFEIDFVDVTDESLNEASDTVPLTLALRSSPPYSLADLEQLQITDASVMGVSDDFLGYGIVRVYFNGPVLDATTELNWAAFQSGPHPEDPSAGVVTAPDATTLPSLLALLSDYKAKFNAHLVEAQIHLQDDADNTITLADPTDQTEATLFIADVQSKHLAHLDALRMHLYPDVVNTFNEINVYPGMPNEGVLTRAIANQSLKAKFNAHLQDEYPITQFVWPWGGALYKIEDWSVYGTNRHHETRSPYTLFADLHLVLRTHVASVRLEATLTSEDGFSTTTPADFTGSIVARPGNAVPIHMSTLVETDRAVEVTFDHDLILPGPDSVDVLDEDGRSAGSGPVRVTSNIPDLQRALKHVMNAYRWHLGGSGAGHQKTDNQNTLSTAGTEAPNLPTLQALMESANEFRDLLTSHMGNSGGEWHEHPDPNVIRTNYASDFETVFTLIDNVIRTYLRHNGGASHNGQAPHTTPGFRIFNAPYLTVLRAEALSMLDGSPHEAVGDVRGTYYENHVEGELGVLIPPFMSSPIPVGERKFHNVSLSVPFTGVATRPSLASVVSKSGLASTDEGVRLGSDMVKAFFSKPMRQVILDTSNLALSGGSTLQKESSWIDDRVASIQVVNMTAIPHTLTAAGLTDEAGNPVY